MATCVCALSAMESNTVVKPCIDSLPSPKQPRFLRKLSSWKFGSQRYVDALPNERLRSCILFTCFGVDAGCSMMSKAALLQQPAPFTLCSLAPEISDHGSTRCARPSRRSRPACDSACSTPKGSRSTQDQGPLFKLAAIRKTFRWVCSRALASLHTVGKRHCGCRCTHAYAAKRCCRLPPGLSEVHFCP
jgi:hypothetical protein